MNESGRQKRGGEGNKLMAQESPAHYTRFKEMISEIFCRARDWT